MSFKKPTVNSTKVASLQEIRKRVAETRKKQSGNFVTWEQIEGDNVAIVSFDGTFVTEEKKVKNTVYKFRQFRAERVTLLNLVSGDQRRLFNCDVPVTAYSERRMSELKEQCAEGDTAWILTDHEFVTENVAQKFHKVSIDTCVEIPE